MKYKLFTREVRDSDLSTKCPFMPEDSDFEMYLNALIEDIGNLDIVLNVSNSSGTITIEVKDESTYQELRAKVKELLKGEMFCKLRANFEEVKYIE